MSAPTAKSRPFFRTFAPWLLLLTALLGVWVVYRTDTRPSTNDAFAWADSIAVSAEVSGRITELAVQDNQWVQAGQLLFRIDSRSYANQLSKAKASLAQLDQSIMLAQRNINAEKYAALSAKASVDRAQANAGQAADTLRRQEPLLDKGHIAPEQVDRSRTTLRDARAQLQAAQWDAQRAQAAVSGLEAMQAQRQVLLADIAQASLEVERCTVVAAFTGRVVNLRTAVGQFVSPGAAVFTLLDTEHWYVVANFREGDLKPAQVGTPVRLYLMSDSHKEFDGQVESIGYGVLPQEGGTSSGGLPSVPRSINWVRVAQRFPVRIRVQAPDPALFRVGASAVATLVPATSAAANPKP